jgi:hypothetical protein
MDAVEGMAAEEQVVVRSSATTWQDTDVVLLMSLEDSLKIQG